MAKKRLATAAPTTQTAEVVEVPRWERDRRESNHTFMSWFIERYRETLRDLSRT